MVAAVAWHVLSSTYFDFDRFERDARADRSPGHVLPRVAARLGAEVHQPATSTDDVGLVDRLGALLYGRAIHWEQARRLLPRLQPGDAVYAAGDDSGVPLALLCGSRRRGVDFAISFIDVTRRRTRFIGWLLILMRVRVMLIVPTDQQVAEAKRTFGRRAVAIDTIDGLTDTEFFRPPQQRQPNQVPLVAGCGVEQRDYATVGDALGEAKVTVQVCFASPNQSDKTRYTMPSPVPANMEFRHMEFGELRSLYQQADVMVLAVRENRYSAGLTSLFEAIACEAPVIVSESPGIIDRLIAEGLVVGVPVGRPDAVREAVDGLLSDPKGAAARAVEARKVLLERYSSDAFLDRLDGMLQRFLAAR